MSKKTLILFTASALVVFFGFLIVKAAPTITETLTFSGPATDITTLANQNFSIMPNGTGNVGISTTAPSEKLEVAGNLVLSPDTYAKSRRLFLLVTQLGSSHYVRLGLPENYVGYNGGGVRIKATWMGSHAAGSSYREYSFAYGTVHYLPDNGYLTVSKITSNIRGRTIDSYGPYTPDAEPELEFYLDPNEDANGYAGVVIKILGYFTPYHNSVLLEAEIFGNLPITTSPSFTSLGTTPPSGISLLAKETIIDGSVGIGTAAPGAKLDVSGSFKAGSIQVPNFNTAGTVMNDSSGNFYTSPAASSILWGGATSGNIWNLNSGKVGIGTPAPDSKLHVEGSHTGGRGIVTVVSSDDALLSTEAGSGTSGLRPQNTARTKDNFIGYSVTNDRLEFDYGFNGADMVINSSGNVGIGTASPDSRLHVKASGAGWQDHLVLESSTGQDWDVLVDSGASDKLRFAAQGGSEALTLQTDGKVGIGTASPGYKLHVIGDIYANGGWLRTSGTAGWYSESYGGGWYMEDSTWIRAYNSKPVYMSAGFDTGSASGVGCGGGLGGGYTFKVCGSTRVSDVYSDDWFRNYNRLGFYNQTYGNHFYTDSASYWRMSSNYGLVLNDSTTYDSTVRGYLYHDDSNNFGLLASDGNWRLRTFPGGQELYGNTYFPGSGIWNSSGNVGIGKTDPGNKLDIATAGAYDSGIWLSGKVAMTTYSTSDTWLRLNQSGSFTSGVYTPGLLRVDGGIQVTGALKSTGSAKTYGGIDIWGKKTGQSYSGINFFDNSGTYESTFMVDKDGATGMYEEGYGWQWYWSSPGATTTPATLTVGTVPWARVSGDVPASRVTAGTFSGNYTFTGSVTASNLYSSSGASVNNLNVYGVGAAYGIQVSGDTRGVSASGGTYGVYASGTYGVRGVGGNYGVYGTSPGNYGVYGDGGTYTGVYGHGDSRGMIGDTSGAGHYAFYASVSDGATKFGPFTGGHDVILSEDFPLETKPGMILSVTGETKRNYGKDGIIDMSSTLPTVKLSTKINDKSVFGVFTGERKLERDDWYLDHAKPGERFAVANALGEGRVLVTNINGNIVAGDYITTSEIPGYGMKQNDDILHSYTLGKATEDVDWDKITETVKFDGQEYKVYLIGVVYTSG